MSTCIVSAYFKIPSKLSHLTYYQYLINFFENVKGNVVFFTSKDFYNEIETIVKDKLNIKFVIESFSELESIKKFGIEFWNRQYERDPERYHSPELGVIWCEKKEFILRASKVSKADVYIWCDAGCVRNNFDVYGLRNFGFRRDINDGKMHLWRVKRPEKKLDFYKFPNVCIACGIMGGNICAWKKFVSVYDLMLTKYDESGVTATSDQNVTLSCVDSHPELFKLYVNDSEYETWVGFLHIL
jgi:hypothetical protein